MTQQACASAPYTPATVKWIRDQSERSTDVAMAAELGWAVSLLRNVANRHEISLIKAIVVPGKPVMKPKLEVVPPPKPKRPPVVRRPDPPPISGLTWDEANGIVMRDGAAIELHPSRRPYFSALFAAHQKSPTERASSASFKFSAGYVSRRMGELKSALAPLGLTIEAKHACGYRLVDLLASQKEAAE